MVLLNKHTSLRVLTNYKNILAVLLLSSTLLSCSSTDEDEDNSDLVAELSEINQQFEPDVVWEESVGDGRLFLSSSTCRSL